jgi:hypothetical protein
MYYDKSIQRAFKSLWGLKHRDSIHPESAIDKPDTADKDPNDPTGLLKLCPEALILLSQIPALEVCLPLRAVAAADGEAQPAAEEDNGNGHVMTMDEIIQGESDHYKSGSLSEILILFP